MYFTKHLLDKTQFLTVSFHIIYRTWWESILCPLCALTASIDAAKCHNVCGKHTKRAGSWALSSHENVSLTVTVLQHTAALKHQPNINSPVLFSVLQQLRSPSPWLLLMWVHLGLLPWKHILQTTGHKCLFLFNRHISASTNLQTTFSLSYKLQVSGVLRFQLWRLKGLDSVFTLKIYG